MGLRRALVDQARVIRVTGTRVGGSTQPIEVPGPLFLARFYYASPDPEATDDGRVSVVRTPQLLFGLIDSEGGEVVLHAEDKVEVVSDEFGVKRFMVNGEPQPIRRRKRMMGWLANLRRVDERGRR